MIGDLGSSAARLTPLACLFDSLPHNRVPASWCEIAGSPWDCTQPDHVVPWNGKQPGHVVPWTHNAQTVARGAAGAMWNGTMPDHDVAWAVDARTAVAETAAAGTAGAVSAGMFAGIAADGAPGVASAHSCGSSVRQQN